MIIDSWDSYLSMFKPTEMDVYFTEEYCSLYSNIDRNARAFVYVEDDSIFLFPFLSGDIPGNIGLADFETPYGYGGPIVNNTAPDFLDRANQLLIKELKNTGHIAGFVRFHPLLNNQSFTRESMHVIRDRNTIYMDLNDSVDSMWHNQLHSKNRNVIRKAEKSGLIYLADYEYKYIDSFIDLYESTMQKVDANEFYFFNKNYYYSFRDKFSKNSFLSCVLNKEEKLIAAAIILFSKDYGHYHLAGSDSNWLHFSPNNFLIWNSACELLKNGIKKFHLGGGTSNNETDSLFKFKKRFSTHISAFYVGKMIINTSCYSEIKNDWIKKYPEKEKDFGKLLLCYRY